MKVEVEINCFVIEPTNQRYHASLFFYSWIRTDLDPSRREFTEQTHGMVDVQQKSVTGIYIAQTSSFQVPLSREMLFHKRVTLFSSFFSYGFRVFKWLISSGWSTGKTFATFRFPVFLYFTLVLYFISFLFHSRSKAISMRLSVVIINFFNFPEYSFE